MHALKVVICPKQKHCCFTPKQIFCTGNVMAELKIFHISTGKIGGRDQMRIKLSQLKMSQFGLIGRGRVNKVEQMSKNLLLQNCQDFCDSNNCCEAKVLKYIYTYG